MQRYPIRPALLLALIALLMLASAAPLYAAGESLSRAAVLSGGGSDSAAGGGLRSALGEPIVGLAVAGGGATLCSGFMCASALVPAPCSPLTAMAVNGPTIGVPGVPYTYTAIGSPSTATGPVLYTWSPEPGSGQDTNTAAFTFVITGTQVISVTASNCEGSAVVEDEHSVTISESGGGGPLYLPSLQYIP